MYPMATQFNDKKQDERLAELRGREEEQLAEMLSKKYGVEYADLTSKSIDTDALRTISEAEARSAEVAAFRKINKKLLVAMRSPERPDALQALEKLTRLGYQVERFIVSHASLLHAWDRYHDISYATETEAGILTLSNETIQQMLEKLKALDDVRVEITTFAASRDTQEPPTCTLNRRTRGCACATVSTGSSWKCSCLMRRPTRSSPHASNY
ncbi:MAG: hypothetical protein UY94_C0042G0005 [Parcubacteria group bacterium GW2011_GWA2_56_21]|nr:MAG: hypothetical protein UY94_C0042G0005 [Parcubacteria group bacterium GW2011_GWA2_56_21]